MDLDAKRPTGHPKKTRINSETHRNNIRIAWIIRKLHRHIAGEVEMTMSQVRAADVLLRKVVPDVVTSHVTAELTHRYVVEVPPLLTEADWIAKHGRPALSDDKTIDLPALPWTIDQTRQGNGHTK